MLLYLLICITAFGAALLTFFSGFGLGTLLTPVFVLFFPVEVAIALTGIVHFFNNLFKLFLVGANANKKVLRVFGIPAIITAFLGAWVLLQIKDFEPLFRYTLFEKALAVYPIKFVVAILLLFFALVDIIPSLRNIQFEKDKLFLGGLLSGFFGGLSGNQGALRSAFLIKAGLSKEAYVATGVVVSSFIDFTRLSVYATHAVSIDLKNLWPLLVLATLSAMAGAFLGNKLLKKVTLVFMQNIVAFMLIIIALALGAGII